MANTNRQNNLLVNQDWEKVYESFRNADFQSYDYQTLRKSMIDYLKIYYPEDFNDFIESSEYIALLDLIAFLGQSIAFRVDLNARENFIDTAERRDSVLKLAKLISYNPKRNQGASGLLKVESIQTTESLIDSNGNDLTNAIVTWDDSTNENWFEQFSIILNASLPTNQKIGKPSATKVINDITTDEYGIEVPSGQIPIFSFNSSVDNVIYPFEIVSATTSNKDFVYEKAPERGAPFNILYRNDNRGFGSNNTGFFLLFKQGTAGFKQLSFTESIPNNVFPIDVNNINNDDVWLYENDSDNLPSTLWEKSLGIYATNVIYNPSSIKKLYQVNSRTNDQIDLVFGDGSFSEIPQGNFTVYYRTSAGVAFNITPNELQEVQIVIPYVSASNRVEQMVIIASLKYTVGNARNRETLDEIKTKAPQQYYTQNRMVTGEDYNIFPYTNFSSISKVKAVNRTSSGISRFLDVNDKTGRYSSTNIFAEDGSLYKKTSARDDFRFTWDDRTDIKRMIDNQLFSAIKSKNLLHFYYENFSRFSLTNLRWERVTIGSSSSTGYLTNLSNILQQVGPTLSDNRRYIQKNAIVIFNPGIGKYFDNANRIRTIPATGIIPAGGKTKIYASIVNLTGDGTYRVEQAGFGPINLSQNIPSDAIAEQVIPSFSNVISSSLKDEITNLVYSYQEFGLRYSQLYNNWQVVKNENLNVVGDFSQSNQGDSTSQNLDSSWLIKFSVSGYVYTVEVRNTEYVFESTREVKFYFDRNTKVFDPVTGKTITDTIKILKVNNNLDTGTPLSHDIPFFVYDQPIEPDGYINGKKLLLTYNDSDDDGVPDNPDIFNEIVRPTISSPIKRVFYKKVYGYNNFLDYEQVLNSDIVSLYPIKLEIQKVVNNYEIGTVFWAETDKKFYIIVSSNGIRSVSETTEYVQYEGRESLYFQYRHNAPGDRRIDPAPNNIIDLYILTNSYESEYRTWLLTDGNPENEPFSPSSEDLRLEYQDLENYKSVSDTIIYNSAKFKPIFGNLANSELRATFKIVKNQNLNLSDNEIRSEVLRLINVFFRTENWNFGDTFYFTELATYIQQQMSPKIVSIVLVPSGSGKVFGMLQQITSEPDEILVSSATIDDIEIVNSITLAQLLVNSN